MPIPFNAVLGLLTQYTPSRGASGVGVSVANALEGQKQNRLQNVRADAYLGMQQDEARRRTETAATMDRRKLLDSLQAAVRAGDTTAARAVASELDRMGIGVDLPERATASGPAEDPYTADEPQEAPAEPAEPGAAAPPEWLTQALGERGDLEESSAAPEPAPDDGPPAWLETELASRGDIETPEMGSPVLGALARAKTPEAGGAPSSSPPDAAGASASAANRFRVYEKDSGRELFGGEMGPEDHAGNVRAVYGPIVEGARTDEERRINGAAAQVAEHLTQIMPSDEAVKVAESYRRAELDRSSKEARGGHGRGALAPLGSFAGAAPGASSGPRVLGSEMRGRIAEAIANNPRAAQAYRALNMDIRNWWRTDESAKQLAQIHKGSIAMDAALSNARDPNANNKQIGQFMAQIVRAVNTGVATEADVDRIRNASRLDQLEAYVRRVTGGGVLTPAEVQDMVVAAETVRAAHRRYQQEQAGSAAQVAGQIFAPQGAAIHPGLENFAAEAIYALVMGQQMPDIMGTQWTPPHERAATPGAPTASGKKNALDELTELGL